MRVLRAAGVKTEAELAFAGLHQLVWPLRAFLGQLAPRPATALLRRARAGGGRLAAAVHHRRGDA